MVGLARSRFPRNVLFEVAAFLGNAAHRMTRGYWEQAAPTVWPPRLSYAQMRRVPDRVLPRARFRRYLLWQYSSPGQNRVSRTYLFKRDIPARSRRKLTTPVTQRHIA